MAARNEIDEFVVLARQLGLKDDLWLLVGSQIAVDWIDPAVICETNQLGFDLELRLVWQVKGFVWQSDLKKLYLLDRVGRIEMNHSSLDTLKRQDQFSK